RSWPRSPGSRWWSPPAAGPWSGFPENVAAPRIEFLDTAGVATHTSSRSWAERTPWQGAFGPEPEFAFAARGLSEQEESVFTSEVSRSIERGHAGEEAAVALESPAQGDALSCACRDGSPPSD